MKQLIKKCLITGILSLSMLAGSVAVPGMQITAYAAEKMQTGGRMDITLGTHSGSKTVTARLSNHTWVEMYDKNWNKVWAGAYNSGTHVLYCGSNVYTVTFYLELDKMANITW